MKKIIAILDALQFNEAQLKGYYHIAKAINGKIAIVLLEQTTEQAYPLAAANPEVFANTFEPLDIVSKQELEQRVRDGMNKLVALCDINHIDLSVHEATGMPAAEIQTESRFADLLLINRSASFSTLLAATNPSLLSEVLAGAQCPVLVMPEELTPIKEIIFTCNGSASSMYAIRQFTQIMDTYTDLPVQVVYVDEGHGDLPHKQQIREYLESFYDRVIFTRLKGDPARTLVNYLSNRRDAIVTFGAYGRSNLSRFFHRSDADDVLRLLQTPLFITHP